MPGDTHNPNGPEQVALGGTAWAEGWTRPLSSLPSSAILWFYLSWLHINNLGKTSSMKDNMTPFSLWITCAESLAGSQIKQVIELFSRTKVKFKLHTYQHGPCVLCRTLEPFAWHLHLAGCTPWSSGGPRLAVQVTKCHYYPQTWKKFYITNTLRVELIFQQKENTVNSFHQSCAINKTYQQMFMTRCREVAELLLP